MDLFLETSLGHLFVLPNLFQYVFLFYHIFYFIYYYPLEACLFSYERSEWERSWRGTRKSRERIIIIGYIM